MKDLTLSTSCDRHPSPFAAIKFDLSHERKLRHFIQKRVLNPEDAEDLLQLTYLEAWRNREKFNGQAKPDTWLCGIAMNLIRNHFRRFYAQPQHSAFDDADAHVHEQSMDPSLEFESRRMLERTLSAMARLPQEMRDTLHTAIEADGSYRDTAQTLGIPIGTVRSRLSRAREHLKRSVYQEVRA
ncbi:RNA polymerase sigma factor [Pseudomonas borbori]